MSHPMTPTSPEIEVIRLRCEKATKPPWRTSPTWTNFAGAHCVMILAGQHADPGDDDALAAVLGGVPSEWQANNNAEFMAHAREDIPLLLSALLDAARQIEGLEAECRAWHLVRDSKGERVSWPPGEAATFTTLPVLAKHLAAADAARAANKATDAHAARGE